MSLNMSKNYVIKLAAQIIAIIRGATFKFKNEISYAFSVSVI